MGRPLCGRCSCVLPSGICCLLFLYLLPISFSGINGVNGVVHGLCAGQVWGRRCLYDIVGAANVGMGGRVSVCLRGVSSPTSMGGLSFGRLGSLDGRVHTSLLRGLDRRNKRFKPGFKVIRTAVTLRCMFGSPRSGVIFSMSRRDCIRGVLAKQGSTFLCPTRCSGMSNCSRPRRDGRSFFIVNRASASIDLTDKLTGKHSLANNGRGVVTIVNSKSLDNNRTFRKLSCITRLNAGVVVVIGSGRVSVTRGRNNLCGGLGSLHSDGNRYRYGFFGTVKLSCVCIGSNGGIRTLIRTFSGIGSVRRPVMMRVGALGNGKCRHTRLSGRACR